ncbi:adenosylmethionine decarboxylase [Propionivibrio sp.]|uniref:adenosylmethionine decarboxylase n=1 Tax=Propionivibrio sp. TaxID=2212460 RepID=UPI00262015AA|nr:adenosylmethionine decarboxylase [Propionivibrio sp.]
MNGLHLIAELHDCRCASRLLCSVDALRELCLAVCAVPGLTPVGQVFHQFGSAAEPAGATGAVILAESHLAVHTWPEQHAATLDLYVCNFSQDNSIAARAACEQLIAAFAPQRVELREVQRGAPSAMHAAPCDAQHCQELPEQGG